MVVRQRNVTKKEIVSFIRQSDLKERNIVSQEDGRQKTIRILKSDEEFSQIINVMIIDQRIEEKQDETIRAVDYNFPGALNNFDD